MAQLVTMLGITHNPVHASKLFEQAQQPPGRPRCRSGSR